MGGVAGDRAEQLGASHQDTITSMHNLAELYRAIGDEDAAHEVQQQVISAAFSRVFPVLWHGSSLFEIKFLRPDYAGCGRREAGSGGVSGGGCAQRRQ